MSATLGTVGCARGREGSCRYLVGVVLVDDADVLAVREPEEAEVFGFLQVAVQVVENLTSAEGKRKDCAGHRRMVGKSGPGGASISPHREKILKIALTSSNDTEYGSYMLAITVVLLGVDFSKQLRGWK